VKAAVKAWMVNDLREQFHICNIDRTVSQQQQQQQQCTTGLRVPVQSISSF
jgi:hypothetical protein